MDRGMDGTTSCAASSAALAAHQRSAQQVRATALVRGNLGFVSRLLRNFGVPEADLDDAGQQVFLAGTRRLSQIPSGSERSFLYGTAVRTAANVRRLTKRRQRGLCSTDVEEATTDWSPQDAFEHRQELELLDRALRALTAEACELLLLYEVEGLTAPEIAARAGVPLGTVASRIRRARLAFSSELKRLHAENGGQP